MNQLDKDVLAWHHSKDLINGSTDEAQFKKMLEEVIEYYSSINPGDGPSVIVAKLHSVIGQIRHEGRIKTFTAEDCEAEKKDTLGDIQITIANPCARAGYTPQEALQSAFDVVSKRKGKKINGIFVKADDLSLYDQGYVDCREGVEHVNGKGEDYDNGYNRRYSEEARDNG